MFLSCLHEILHEDDDQDDGDKCDNRRQGDDDGVGMDIHRESSLFQFLSVVHIMFISSHHVPEQVKVCIFFSMLACCSTAYTDMGYTKSPLNPHAIILP